MKELFVLRHAKSSWKDASLADQERPLSPRGRRDAPRMGRLLARSGVAPDLILSSLAVRARETARLVAEAAGFTGEIEIRSALYHAGAPEYRAALAELPDRYACVLLVGHNPGLEELVADLVGEPHRLPTAAMAWIRLPIAGWREIGATGGELVELWRPKEIADHT